MRLTVNLDTDLYALAKSLAKAEDCSISAAVNRLLARAFRIQPPRSGRGHARAAKRNGFVITRGKRPVTADTVRAAEAEDDTQ